MPFIISAGAALVGMRAMFGSSQSSTASEMVVELIDSAHGERAAEPIRTVTSRASLHDDRCLDSLARWRAFSSLRRRHSGGPEAEQEPATSSVLLCVSSEACVCSLGT